jgi:hypothetical protein
MSETRKGHDANSDAGTPERAPDTEAALQRELNREESEGSGTTGDMGADRNLSGSSTWVTLPPPDDDATQPADREITRAASRDAADSADEGRDAARDEIADRLRRRGVNLTGREKGEELVEILEAVERFEVAVQDRGGDLMVDEPVGDAPPIEPDDRAFVLPKRAPSESVASFIERIAEARDQVTRGPGRE